MRILTLSSLYPAPGAPLAGVFVRERVRHVARLLPAEVVAPVPWSPADPLLRLLRPGFRRARAVDEPQAAPPVHRPRWLSPPGLLKELDPSLYAACVLPRLRRLRSRFPFDLIDAHFTWPDGAAARRLAAALGVPYTVTLRGTEVPHARDRRRLRSLVATWRDAARVIAVSRSLAELAVAHGCPEEKVRVIPNGVDPDRFRPLPRDDCRRRLGLAPQAKVLLTVGGLVERKGVHRVLEVLPRLAARHPDLVYVVVGGGSAEGDREAVLREQARTLGVAARVRFEGPQPPERLPEYYGAADLFVLASSNEGWANAIAESLACGTPVVATDVGGNGEQVAVPELGRIVPHGDAEALCAALDEALACSWDRDRIAARGGQRTWETVANEVVAVFAEVLAPTGERTGRTAVRLAGEGRA